MRCLSPQTDVNRHDPARGVSLPLKGGATSSSVRIQSLSPVATKQTEHWPGSPPGSPPSSGGDLPWPLARSLPLRTPSPSVMTGGDVEQDSAGAQRMWAPRRRVSHCGGGTYTLWLVGVGYIRGARRSQLVGKGCEGGGARPGPVAHRLRVRLRGSPGILPVPDGAQAKRGTWNSYTGSRKDAPRYVIRYVRQGPDGTVPS